MAGSAQLKARASVVRQSLKEAGGKPLARRTETAYKAYAVDKTPMQAKVQKPHGNGMRKCGGWMRGKISFLPGEVSQALRVDIFGKKA